MDRRKDRARARTLRGGTPRTRAPRIVLPAVLGAAVLAGGCAGLGKTSPPARPSVLADSSPELDFLLGREHELDGRLEEALVAYVRASSKDPDSAYLLKQAAELSARLNRLNDAVGYAERAFALDPSDPGLRLFLGTLYRFSRDAENARRVLADPDGAPVSPDAALLLYGVLSEAREHTEARRVAEWMIEAEPEGLRGYLALADALERLGDPASAEAALRRGIEAHPGELTLYGALARARRDRGDRAGEIDVYHEMLAVEPDHHATLIALAEAELEAGRVDDAVATLEGVLRDHPDDLRSLLRLAFIEYERDRLGEARRHFEKARAASPEQHEVAYFLGVTLRRLDDEEAAVAVFEAIPESHDRYPEARTQLAAIYEGRGELEAAVAEVERARAASPSRPLDLYLASLQAKAGDPEAALAFLHGLLAESPDDVELLYNIGVIHGEAKNVDAAIRTMNQVLEKDPDHAGALNYVGYTWAELGTNLDEAEAMISRALEIRPEDGYITDSLGWVYYMRARPLVETGRTEEAQGLLERAVSELERALELTGGDPVIVEHLGDVFLLLGEKERALHMYEEALGLEPRFDEQPELLEKLERLRRELGGR